MHCWSSLAFIGDGLDAYRPLSLGAGAGQCALILMSANRCFSRLHHISRCCCLRALDTPSVRRCTLGTGTSAPYFLIDLDRLTRMRHGCAPPSRRCSSRALDAPSMHLHMLGTGTLAPYFLIDLSRLTCTWRSYAPPSRHCSSRALDTPSVRRCTLLWPWFLVKLSFAWST